MSKFKDSSHLSKGKCKAKIIFPFSQERKFEILFWGVNQGVEVRHRVVDRG